MNINYLMNRGFEEAMFNDAEIIQAGAVNDGDLGFFGNLLYANSAGMTLTFKLDLPEPCYGSFTANGADSGFQFWGEAV